MDSTPKNHSPGDRIFWVLALNMDSKEELHMPSAKTEFQNRVLPTDPFVEVNSFKITTY